MRKSLSLATLVLCGCIAASAQNAPDQDKDKGQNLGQEPPPVADKGTTAQYNCISDEGQYVQEGRQAIYRITFTNKCEQRLKCKVFAYSVSSKGMSQGHATLILAAKSKGAAAMQVYPFKVKSFGGMLAESRECKVI